MFVLAMDEGTTVILRTFSDFQVGIEPIISVMLVDYAPLFTLYQTTTIVSFKHGCIQMHSVLS